MQLFHIGLRHTLQPDRLPDAGHRGIPHAAPFQSLLAVGHILPGQIVPDLNDDLVFLFQNMGNVIGTGLVTTHTAPQKLPIDIDRGDLVRRTDVQQHPATVKPFRQYNSPAVGQGAVFREMLPNAGEGTFGTEGHPDSPAVFPGQVLPLGYGKVPVSVEVQVRIPLHLGPGIYRPGSPRQVLSGFRCQINQHGSPPSSA